MAELTTLETKLGEVLGLAMAAQDSIQKVKKLAQDEGNDALDGFEFLTMAEAGEVGHWAIVGVLSRRASNEKLQRPVEWAKPIRERHLREAMEGSLKLAGHENPHGTG